MPTRVTGRLLREPQLRGADLEMFWSYLKENGGLKETELHRRFAVGSTTLMSSTLDFLCDLNLVECQYSEGERYYRVTRVDPMPSFRVRLLKALHEQREQDGAFHAILEYIIRNGLPGFFSTRTKLKFVEQVEREVKMELAFTGEKMEAWQHLATFIGLVRPLESEHWNHLVAPSPDLVKDLLHYALPAPTGTIDLSAWVKTVETDLCPLLTKERHLHPGVGQTLLAMETMGWLQIPPAPADMARFKLSEERSAATVELGGNTDAA